MKKTLIVLSLGGSLIVPNKINLKYLSEFKKMLKKHKRKYKFIIVCGGGKVAREYISALKKTGINETMQSMIGISVTRTNARFLSYFFNQNPWKGIPQKTEEIHRYLKKQDIVFCGALDYKPNQTSDSTSAEIAKHFKISFVNLTNVPGLFDKNPKRFRNAKLIPLISWKKFNEMASEIPYRPGQHFVLDQKAAKIILENKIPTYIIGSDLKELGNLLNGRKFTGTEIRG